MRGDRTVETRLDAIVMEQWGSRQADLGPHGITTADAEWVKFIGRKLEGRAQEITEGFVAWCIELFPRARPPGGDLGPLSNSVHDNMTTMWGMVASGLEPHAVDPPPNALVWPRKMIHARVPLGTMMRIYYVGHAMIWHRWVQPELVELATNGVNTSLIAARLHSLSFTYLDRAALKVAEQYHAGVLELTASSTRARLEAVRDVLAGAEPSLQAREAMDFSVDGRHRAWILWLPPGGPGRWPGLPALAETLHTMLGRDRSHGSFISIEQGPAEICGWTVDPVELDDAMIEQLRDMLSIRLPRAATPQGDTPLRNVGAIRLALGTPYVGVAGFREGYQEVRALRTAMDRARCLPDHVLSSSSAGLAALLMSDPQAARRFARRTLGSLVSTGGAGEALRSTLRAFLDSAGSYQRTAERLGVHRNTVLHRLQRCESELGRPISGAESEISAALIILDWLPDQI